MKKTLIFLTTLILIFSIVIGCSSAKNEGSPIPQATANNTPAATGNDGKAEGEGPKAADISGTVRVVVAGWQLEDSIDPITGQKSVGVNNFLNDTFKNQYPKINLQVTSIPWENAQAKMTSMLISGDADVLYLAGGWSDSFYQQGLLMSLDDLMANDKDFDPGIFIKKILETSYATKSSSGNEIIGLPQVMGQRMPIYDKKIFEDWGVEPLSANPTPQEVLEKAQKMTGKNPKTGEQNYGLYWDGQDLNLGPYVGLIFAYDAPVALGSVSDPKNLQWKINEPGMVKVFKWFEKAALLPPVAFLNRQGAENFGLENNNIAIKMSSDGQAIMSQFRVSGDRAMLDRFVPTLDLGPNGENQVAVDPIVIAKKAKNLEASWEVTKFLSGYEAQKFFYKNFNQTPALANPDFLDPDDKFTANSIEIARGTTELGVRGTPFQYSDFIPGVINFVSQVRNGQKVDIQKYLDDLQSRAEKWSASQ